MSRTFRFNGEEYIPGVPMYGLTPGSLVEVDDDNQIVSITPIAIENIKVVVPPVTEEPLEDKQDSVIVDQGHDVDEESSPQ